MNDRHQRTAYPLRLPDDVREELQKHAESIGRSLNAEIVARLQWSLVPGNMTLAGRANVVVGGVASQGLAMSFEDAKEIIEKAVERSLHTHLAKDGLLLPKK